MKFEVVPVTKLKPSKYNPPDRVESGISSLMNNVKKNMECTEYGLLAPIVVANDYTIIDGHRRYTVAVNLGIKKVPVIKHNSSSHELHIADGMWVSANNDTNMISGHQWLWRYMNGVSVAAKPLSRIKTLEKWLGKRSATALFKKILARGQSANTYQFGMGRYRAYTGKTSVQHMKKVAYYLLNVETSYRVRCAIEEFIPVNVLIYCVETRQKIASDFRVAS